MTPGDLSEGAARPSRLAFVRNLEQDARRLDGLPSVGRPQ